MTPNDSNIEFFKKQAMEYAARSLPLPADNETLLEEFLSEHNGRGTLKIQVAAAKGTIPIENATVLIERLYNGGSITIFDKETNESGIVDDLVLPALPAIFSQNESTAENSGTEYFVSINHPSYIPIYRMKIKIYDAVNTILPVALQPKV